MRGPELRGRRGNGSRSPQDLTEARPERESSADNTFRPDIQGLRAIAVAAVVLYHAGVPFLPGGYVGVDIFFVISGFLITSHLLRGLERTGRVSFASFYARRARRILPASFTVLLLSVVAAMIWYPPLLMGEVWKGAVATALYVPNYLFAVNGTNYLAETTPSLFQHYWSLGIEEQFYLLWPLLLFLGWAVVKSRRVRFTLLIVIVAASFFAGIYLTYESQPWAFFSLPTRAWELGVGGIVAVALSRRSALLAGPAAAIAGWVGVGCIALTVVTFSSSTPFPGFWAAVPVVATALVILAGASSAKLGPNSLLSTRPMLFIGAISYSLYLVHWPALLIPEVASGGALPLWVTLLIAVACIPVAWGLYAWVENPARNAPFLAKARPRRTLWIAAASSAAAILVATLAYGISEARPLSIDQVAQPVQASAPPTYTSYVPSNLSPSLRAATDDQPDIYADGCHAGFPDTVPKGCVYGDDGAPRIVLLGDSHAAQWFPAVFDYAQSIGYAVQVYTKSACPAISTTVIRDGVPYSECDVWRENAIAAINSERPALVIVASYGREETQRQVEGDWGDALRKTLDSIAAPTAVMVDTPYMGTSPSICLSAHLNDTEACAVPRADALNAPTRQLEARAATSAGVPLLDMTDYICDPETCGTIVGNTLVFRDEHHITAAYSAMLAAPLGAAIEPLLGK